MNDVPLSYSPGVARPDTLVLERFLPNIPSEMIHDWLGKNVEKGAWVIDPFGVSPHLAIEAAQAGYKVLIICNNPILQFMFEFLASGPTENEFLAALSEFAREKRESERLETILRGLYQTECPNCNHHIPVQYYIWEQNQDIPKSKVVVCRQCQTQGEYSLSAKDLVRLEAIGNDSLNRARALQAVDVSPEARVGAKEALNTYLPRSLHFLMMMINRIHRMQTSNRNKQLLTALFLNALDKGNMMWSWPLTRYRPKQINIPSQFRENNLWLSIENAISLWSKSASQIPFAVWPNTPASSSGICLFKGRAGNYLSVKEKVPLDIEAAITVFPRPNQAFWTYSALWSGWIWGRETVLPIRSSLERRRFDWFWYCRALHATLSKLHTINDDNFTLWGIIPELEAGFLISVLVAAEGAGFNLQDIALRNDDEISQNLWKVKDPPARIVQSNIIKSSFEAMKEFLNEKNEPASKLELIAASMMKLAKNREIPSITETMPYFSIQEYQQKIPALLANRGNFIPYESSMGSVERQSWWLQNVPVPSGITLSDRVEQKIIEILTNEKNGITKHDLDKKLCCLFPGLLTPKKELIEICLQSYAEMDSQNQNLWRIKPKEIKEQRVEEIQNIRKKLIEIGSRLEFNIKENEFIEWCRIDTGEILHRFVIVPTTVISRIVFSSEANDRIRKYLVIPGSRSKLLAYKIDADMNLKTSLHNWILLKNRLIDSFAKKDILHYTDWDEIIHNDPPEKDEPTQISIFE